MQEPLGCDAASRSIRSILTHGGVRFSRHAFEEMKADGLTTPDVLNVLRGGVVEPPEFEQGTWRYRVRTPVAYVVVAFRSEEELVVVTAWRIK